MTTPADQQTGSLTPALDAMRAWANSDARTLDEYGFATPDAGFLAIAAEARLIAIEALRAAFREADGATVWAGPWLIQDIDAVLDAAVTKERRSATAPIAAAVAEPDPNALLAVPTVVQHGSGDHVLVGCLACYNDGDGSSCVTPEADPKEPGLCRWCSHTVEAVPA